MRRAPAHTGGRACSRAASFLSWRVCMAMAPAPGCNFCFPSERWGCRLNCLFPVRPASCTREVGGDFYSILGTTGEAVGWIPSSWSVPPKVATLTNSSSTSGEGDFRSFRELLGWVKSTHSQSREALGLAWHQEPRLHQPLDDSLPLVDDVLWNITVPPAPPLNIGRISCSILEFENGSFCVDLSKSLLLLCFPFP